MKITKKQQLIILIAMIIVLVGGGYYLYTLGYFNQKTEKTEYQKDAEGNRVFSDEEIKQYDEYMKQAHEYIVAGDAGDQQAYEKAVEVYKKASAIGDDNFWNPLLGLGSAYRKLHNFEAAEQAYDKAIIASNYGEPKIYQEKIDMYLYDLKKSNEEVKKLYEEALQKVTDNISLVLNFGAFLKSIGDYPGALQTYKLVAEKFPDNELYKKEIANLETKIQK